jgi:hypothetical protein
VSVPKGRVLGVLVGLPVGLLVDFGATHHGHVSWLVPSNR